MFACIFISFSSVFFPTGCRFPTAWPAQVSGTDCSPSDFSNKRIPSSSLSRGREKEFSIHYRCLFMSHFCVAVPSLPSKHPLMRQGRIYCLFSLSLSCTRNQNEDGIGWLVIFFTSRILLLGKWPLLHCKLTAVSAL